ncbi:hypothetical protein EYS08_25410 [Pedobacter kyonggii]|uniref:Uncharacterized protein n=1 Tax=Pedobacter kyonggii TaxID=1926871 RepID=A0A4Q9H5J0_9SPHI|nr:hypothetical protein EYS08_25410 [Pedobacter kyonggii]
MDKDKLYSFVFKGILTEEALDKTERIKKSKFGNEDFKKLHDINIQILTRHLPCTAMRESTPPDLGYRVDTSLWISQPCIDALKYLMPIQRVVIPGCLLLS